MGNGSTPSGHACVNGGGVKKAIVNQHHHCHQPGRSFALRHAFGYPITERVGRGGVMTWMRWWFDCLCATDTAGLHCSRWCGAESVAIVVTRLLKRTLVPVDSHSVGRFNRKRARMLGFLKVYSIYI